MGAWWDENDKIVWQCVEWYAHELDGGFLSGTGSEETMRNFYEEEFKGLVLAGNVGDIVFPHYKKNGKDEK